MILIAFKLNMLIRPPFRWVSWNNAQNSLLCDHKNGKNIIISFEVQIHSSDIKYNNYIYLFNNIDNFIRLTNKQFLCFGDKMLFVICDFL